MWLQSCSTCFASKLNSGGRYVHTPPVSCEDSNRFCLHNNMYLDPKNKYKLEKDRDKISRVISENKIKLIYGLEENVICELKNCISKKSDTY